MKKLLWFHLDGCPYCIRGEQAYEELKKENPDYAKIEVDYVEEDEHPEISSKYDYQANPALFLDGELKYQAHVGESYESMKENFRRVLDEALNG